MIMTDNKREGMILLELLKKLPLIFISYSMINIYEFFLLGEVIFN